MQHLFHFPILLPVESEYQATEDAEKYRRRYQKAGDFIEEPEELSLIHILIKQLYNTFQK